MKKARTVFAYQIILSTVLFITAMAILVSAQSSSSNSVVVVASVLPERSIVVNQDLTIQKIYSNTTENVRPSVYLNSLDGQQMAYSDAIRGQYQSLKSSIDFSKPGEVYKRPPSAARSAIDSGWHFIKRLLRF